LSHSIENFLSYTSVGLYCAAGDFYIDPRRPVHKALISHAHSDHAVPNSGNIYATKATRQLMSSRYSNYLRSHFHEVQHRNKFPLGEVEVTFYPAGHILGSAQILMEHKGVRYLYTGDFKIQSDESCEKLEFVNADILITETTFADPAYDHPEPVNEIAKINDIKDKPIMLGAYSIGKAQRLTWLISRHCPEKKIFVQREISKFHEVYEKAGINLGNWQLYSRDEFKDETEGVYIVPPNWLSKNSKNKKVYKAFATGWKRYFFYCDSLLHISDHADWKGILTMVEKVQPSKIFTLHGNGSHLKEHLKDKVEVVLLNRHNEKKTK
jgi:putative mRNA 3-end processing factor